VRERACRNRACRGERHRGFQDMAAVGTADDAHRVFGLDSSRRNRLDAYSLTLLASLFTP
jgi:hypothetical protein